MVAMEAIETTETQGAAVHPQAGEPSAALVLANSGEEDFSDNSALHLQAPLSTLPTQLDVCVPLPSFRVSDLIALEPGRVLASEWGSMDDLPLTCGQVQLVWAEFEVVDQKIAVRVTRLV